MFPFDSPENIKKQTTLADYITSNVLKAVWFFDVFKGIKKEHWEEMC